MVALFNDSPELEIPQKTKSNEWYTPAKYIEAAREVMGGVDLDPASCEVANQTVKAARYYTQEDDGLRQDWSGNVWCNPPYGLHPSGKSNVILWSQKLLSAYKKGEIRQAILLTMVNTESSWFGLLWEYPICFPSPRVMFHRPDGSLDHHLQGSCFVYLGPNEDKFIEVFSQFGTIAKRVSPPISKPVNLSLWEEKE